MGGSRNRYRSRGLGGLWPLVLTAAGMVAGWPLLAPAAFAQSVVRQEAAALLEARRAQARPTELVALSYSLKNGDQSDVYLLNTAGYPLDLDLQAVSSSGARWSLGSLLLPAAQHRVLSLKSALGSAPLEFAQGSLSVGFLGDDESVQGWLVRSRGIQQQELPMRTAGDALQGAWISFWQRLDRPGPVSARALFRFLNPGEQPLRLTLTEGQGAEVRSRRLLELAPHHSGRYASPLASGWLRIEVPPESRGVLAEGLLEGAGFLARLPWEALAEPGESRWESLPLASVDSGSVLAFNLGPDPTRMQLELLDATTGQTLATEVARAGSNETAVFDLGKLAAGAGADLRQLPRRLRLTGWPVSVASGWAMSPDGAMLELPWFPARDAHAGGSYPIPDLARHEVITQLVNLGEEASEVAVQISWNGGTYAYGPFLVPAGGARRLDLGAMALAGEPDLLGRTLDPQIPQGFLHWTVLGGSRSLIARTEARRLDGEDHFGFNCFGCCWQLPDGEVVPAAPSFLPGQTVAMQACLTYSTCSGEMGPYSTPPLRLTVPAPFSWNGRQVSASAPASADLLFEGSAPRVDLSCDTRSQPIYGAARPTTCLKLLKTTRRASGSWSVAEACTIQLGSVSAAQKCSACGECCDAIYSYTLCQGGPEAMGEADAARLTCRTLCAVDWQCPFDDARVSGGKP